MERFLAALRPGQLQELMEVMAPDVVLIADAGGLAAAVAAAVAANPTPERWDAGWKVLARAGETTADVAAMAARVLARCRPDGSRQRAC